MADEKVKWDKWSSFTEAIEKSRSGGIVGLCVAQQWSPPSMFVAKQMEVQRKQKAPIFPIFVINHDEDSSLTYKYEVVHTPTLMFFVAGQPVRFRRPTYNDDTRFVGTMSKEQAAAVLTAVKASERDPPEERLVNLDF